ncbi:hypothetical protein BGZ90_005009 [Linnemannia elongata]|nr:hypothetical protein BGZ90_005009 [Linnemannia elongata]
MPFEFISSSWKRKLEEDADDTYNTDGTAPTKSYGIVTDAETWVFLQRDIDTLHNTGYYDPVFHRPHSSASVNYFSQDDKLPHEGHIKNDGQQPTSSPGRKSFVLWDDIRLVFTDALYVRHNTKVVPFMKDAEWMLLKPLRIAAVPDAVLDIVVDNPLVRLEVAVQQTTIADTPKEARGQDTPHEDTTLKLASSPTSNAAPRRNPVYGLVETAMENYSHIDHPDFRPKPRGPQYVPTTKHEEGTNQSTDNASKSVNEPTNINTQVNNDKPSTSYSHRSPQAHTPTAAVRDISPIVSKASLGDTKSQVELGDMYRTGNVVEQDFDKARYWYLKAANQGDPSGQCNVGHLYRLELGVDRDHSTAMSWYKKAADQGHAEGQCYVGLMHDYGLLGAVDYPAAMEWYMMAANQGLAYAQCCIGILYDMGKGVPKDYDKAMEWYLRAAEQGHPLAQLWIGYMYKTGEGVSQDEAIALDWLSKAVSRKDTDIGSQMAMGQMYSSGLGVPKSDSIALTWYLKAARQGSPTAQHILAGMYRDGEGVSQDYSEALSWLIKSANHNHPDAQYDIGTMYLHGQGVPKNYLTAKEWFVKAVKFGSKAAKASLAGVQKLIDEDEKVAKASEKKKKKSAAFRLKFW